MVQSTEASIAPEAPLRDRLISTALDVLATEGIEALSLRRIARGAGVSHGAPHRHFESLADLLAEVAAHGFRLLREGMVKSSEALPPGAGPMARLRGAARAYVAMAVENSALFALMFRPEDLNETNARFAVDASLAFEELLARVHNAQDAGWHPERDTRLLASVVWASVHGLASLWSQGAIRGPSPDVALDDAVELCIELMLTETPSMRDLDFQAPLAQAQGEPT